MAVPYEQELRQQRFVQAHPQWSIHAQGEATTDIEVTSPAHPRLGLVRLSDDGHLEWDCDWRTAFHEDPGTLADVIVPIPRACIPSTARAAN